MAAEWLAKQLRKTPQRFISATGQVGLGIATLLTPATAGTTFAFVEGRIHIPLSIVGGLFIVSGFLLGITTDRRLYFLAVQVVFLFSVVAFIGALNREVSLQAGIIYVTLGFHALRSFPENGNGNGP